MSSLAPPIGAPKRGLADLAVLGGTPAFPAPLHVGRPNLAGRDRFHSLVGDAFDRGRLTNDGPLVRELESRLAAFVGVGNCVATCNGTMALQVLARAAGLSGEVVVPSFTFIGTAHALDWIGLRPVFCDVLADGPTIDPERVSELVTPHTTAILGTHVWGHACDVEALEELARARGLALLFDAAQALGCSHDGRLLGSFGDAEVVSLHATKICHSFEGGAILTDDDDLAARARTMRNFGFDDRGRVVSTGTNGKMSEIAAAMGIASLESWPELYDRNRRNAALYRESLRDVPGLALIEPPLGERSNHHHVVVLLSDDCAIGRDTLHAALQAEGILVRRYFWPGCHRSEPYRTHAPPPPDRLPNTERLADRVLSLPTGTSIGPDEIAVIADVVRLAVDGGRELERRLAGRFAARDLSAPASPPSAP